MSGRLKVTQLIQYSLFRFRSFVLTLPKWLCFHKREVWSQKKPVIISRSHPRNCNMMHVRRTYLITTWVWKRLVYLLKNVHRAFFCIINTTYFSIAAEGIPLKKKEEKLSSCLEHLRSITDLWMLGAGSGSWSHIVPSTEQEPVLPLQHYLIWLCW